MKKLIDLFIIWSIVMAAAVLGWALGLEISWRLLVVIGFTGLCADLAASHKREHPSQRERV